MTVQPVDLAKVTPERVSIYEAIIVAAKRARQINQELRIELNQQLETIAQLTTMLEGEEDLESGVNPDQLKISLEFEKRPKATEIALGEVGQGKVGWHHKETEENPPASEESE